MPAESITRGSAGESAGHRERGDQEENDRGEGLRVSTAGPSGSQQGLHQQGSQTHPEAGQVRQEERREEAVFPGSEKRPHGNGWGVSKPSFLLCFLSDQE